MLEETKKTETLRTEASHRSPRLLLYSDLPPYRQDNPAILSGYRSGTSRFLGGIQSFIIWHNETVNIYSHALPACAIVCLLVIWIFASVHIKNDLDSIALFSPWSAHGVTTATGKDVAVFFVAFFGNLIGLLCSVVLHVSTAHEERVVRRMLWLDRIGIVILGTFNFVPTLYYAFFCHAYISLIYIVVFSISGSVGAYLVYRLQSSSPEVRRKCSTVIFVALGSLFFVPVIHSFCKYGFRQTSSSIGLKWIAVKLAFDCLGGAAYVTRIPEVLAPGRFDYLGSSHQILHLCCLLSIWAYYNAIFSGFLYCHNELQWRCFS